jgi:hypothetical protein
MRSETKLVGDLFVLFLGAVVSTGDDEKRVFIEGKDKPEWARNPVQSVTVHGYVSCVRNFFFQREQGKAYGLSKKTCGLWHFS